MSEHVVSARLRQARKARGWVQQKAADKCAITQAMLAHFEAGSRLPSLGVLQRLCEGMDVSADYLLGLSHDLGGMQSDALARRIQQLSDRDRELVNRLVSAMEHSAPHGKP